ncbi:MAG TPA: HAMP domain-containing sensor histidine kinase, partial [Kofleriaceae bacterium]|nr:HAMP domain-containing sensor histidine kinase [Kofleriaceae bacterium]
LGTLVAGLSHELNNPLSVVLGNVQLLLRNTPEDGSARRPLAAIERQALRCSRLVRALLNFSRARPSVRSRAQPEVLCGAVLDLVEGEARDKQVQVRHQRGADPLPELMVFSQEIESALLNVLSNAIDASPAEGVVELKVRAATEDGVAGVAFAVSDRGNGIAKNVLPRIFDPFFTTKPSGRGTGLGLSIAHQAVTAHGGKIDADSTEGQGTTITIWLPAISD